MSFCIISCVLFFIVYAAFVRIKLMIMIGHRESSEDLSVPLSVTSSNAGRFS